KRLSCIKSLALEIFVDSSVNFVGARFARVVEDASGSLPEFRGEAVLHQGKFLKSVHGGLFFIRNTGIEAAARILPIQDDAVGGPRRAIDVDVIPTPDGGAG